MMKKITAFLTAAAMSATLISPAFASSVFSDVDETEYDWAVENIDNMYAAGYITGYEDGTFKPENEVTRLECLALFSRAMGVLNENNAEILEMAHEDYDTLLANYSLSWGGDEIAYLLYKGALRKTDLDTYLAGNEKNLAMKRYEAAIIITKAMGKESEALDEDAASLAYSDAAKIPTTAQKYVSYVTKAGIMNGMDDNMFSPDSSVSRAQMATMLARTVEKTDYSFLKVKLTEISETDSNIVYLDSDGEEFRSVYTDDTEMRVEGAASSIDDMPVNVKAIIALSGDEVVSVDALSSEPDETVSGVYSSYSSTNGVTSITITKDTDGELETYECASDVTVTYAGDTATIRSFKKGDTIELSLSAGVVTAVKGSEKQIEVSRATVTDMVVGDNVEITISSSDEDYDGKTFKVASNVVVTKNGSTSELSKIYVGDTVTLTLQYNVIQKIVATSTTRSAEGTITSITISGQESSMTISSSGTETTYDIPTDVTITINGEEGSLYDFRIGDSVKVTTESGAITKIAATTTQITSGSVQGTVVGVNASYGFISVKDDETGNTTQVFCKDSSTTFVTSTGTAKKLKDIAEGQTVTARGSITNGAFMGTLVIIESE